MTFFERGQSTFRRLGSTTGGRGVLRMPTSWEAPGRRQVVAQVRLDGAPTPDRVVAQYRVERPPRPGSPARLELRRRGSAVLAAWRPAANAVRYVVLVRQRSGVRRIVRVPGGRHRIRLAGIPATQSGAITVRGIARSGLVGPPSRAAFRARRAAPGAFRPFSELARRSGRP